MRPERGVGRRLAGTRLQRGLSQGTLARLARIAPSYLSRIETGKVQPTVRTLLRVAGALRVPLETLLAGVGGRGCAAHPLCPITCDGECLLDLIRPESEVIGAADVEAYTARQVRLLRRFAAWLRTVDAERLTAMEILLRPYLAEGGSGRRSDTKPQSHPAATEAGRARRSRRNSG